MKRLTDLSDGMNVNKQDIDKLEELCEVCMKSKQTRQSLTTVDIEHKIIGNNSHGRMWSYWTVHMGWKKIFFDILDDETTI